MNNLFSYASKELSTDAFLAWLFRSLSVEPAFEGEAQGFFKRLGLLDGVCDFIGDITVTRQEENTDLIVRCEIDGRQAQFLFENKRDSSMHSGQLDVYKERFPNCDLYIYLKLGFISYAERQKAEQSGYKVLNADVLLGALQALADRHFLVAHYIEYLDKTFVSPQSAMLTGLTPRSFSSAQVQQYFLSSLHQSLAAILPNLKFSSSANMGGTPWTQLTLVIRPLAYGNKSESLFWRIDQRGKGYYLRLTQYANIGETHKAAKKTNLRMLREMLSDMPLLQSFVKGKVVNGGVKSSEALVFFFADNDIEKMADQLPALSIEIVRRYHLIDSWA